MSRTILNKEGVIRNIQLSENGAAQVTGSFPILGEVLSHILPVEVATYLLGKKVKLLMVVDDEIGG